VDLYEVQWGTSSGQYEHTADAVSTNVQISGLQVGETYFFGVRACVEDRTLCSSLSEEVSTTIAVPAAPPVPGFTVSQTSGVAPYVVDFTDSSTGDVDAYAWSFGDGTTSIATSPTHTYTTPGTYTVSLTVTGPGGSATETKTDLVSVAVPPPVASFDASKTSGLAPLSVTFTASTDGIDEWLWNFGDGKTSVGSIAVHTYLTPGTYTVSLTVGGAGGSVTTTKKDLVTVHWPAPVAGFSASNSTGTAPLAVTFTNASSGKITEYYWDFGDGATSFEANPAHTYASPGSFDVTLTVTGPGGSDTVIKTGEVQVVGAQLPIEVGEISLDEGWTRVDFEQDFSYPPIVVATPLSGNDQDPAVVRIESIDSDGFWVRIQEWDYLDGKHMEETVSYIAVERGRHQLPNGTWIEAGSTKVGARPSFVTVSLSAPFASPPVVLAAVTSVNEADAVTTRLRNITAYQFQVGLQEQESSKKGHAPETVAYIAWEHSSGEINGMQFEVGSTAAEVTDSVYVIGYSPSFYQPPVFLADMQSVNDRNTANLRYLYKEAGSVGVWVDEGSSRDKETTHAAEAVGYVFIDTTDAETTLDIGETEPPTY